MKSVTAVIFSIVMSFVVGYFIRDIIRTESRPVSEKLAKFAHETREYSLPLNNPDTVLANEATHMKDDDLVYGVIFKNYARAYPRWIMTAFHVANDTINGKALVVLQCEVCSSAAAFVPEIKEIAYAPIAFTPCGYSKGTFQICDNYTDSLWHPFSGLAFEGPLKGIRLHERIPVVTQKWKQWKENHPQTDVVFASGHIRQRNHNQGHEYGVGEPLIPPELAKTADLSDVRLPPNALVFGVADYDLERTVAFPVKELAGEKQIVDYDLAGQRIVIVKHDEFAISGFYAPRDSGRFRILKIKPFTIVDERGGHWNSFGLPTVDSKNQEPLKLVDGYFAEWYEWASAHPRSDIYGLSPLP